MLLNGNDPILLIYLDSICHNFELMRQKASAVSNPMHRAWPDAMPIIKSDAYGHGLGPVGIALLTAGARAFGVGTVEEAQELRQALIAVEPEKGANARIVALLGAAEDYEVKSALEHGITVFLHRPDQVKMYSAYTKQARSLGLSGKLSVALKLNSGMNRLGFDGAGLLAALTESISGQELEAELVCTHLSSADMPEELDFTREQARIFFETYRQARAIKPEIAGSLCNTAGMMNIAEVTGSSALDLPLTHRPGLALYGSSPLHGTGLAHLGRGLKPAMQMLVPVMDIHDIAAGSSVSYGRTFKAEQDMRIAILRTGYADAFPRLLSNQGHAIIGGRKSRILGRVCMQMLAVEVPRSGDGYLPVAPLDWACLLGDASCDWHGGWQPAPEQEAILAEEIAAKAGTITYEIFCALGKNKRIFVEG